MAISVEKMVDFTFDVTRKKSSIIKEKISEIGYSDIMVQLLKKEIGLCFSGERKVLDLFLFSLFDIPGYTIYR